MTKTDENYVCAAFLGKKAAFPAHHVYIRKGTYGGECGLDKAGVNVIDVGSDKAT